jgi:sorbose reductase
VLEAAFNFLPTSPPTGRAYQVNVTSYESIEASITEIVREFNGRLDVFVANSGICWEDGPFLDGPLTTMQKVLRVNLDGTLYCARAAALHWRRQKKEGTTLDGQKLENFTYGSFISTASMSGSIVNIPQMQAVYNASKSACIMACVLPPVFLAEYIWTNTFCRQVISSGVGRLCPCQLGLARLHPDGDPRLCV